jgi:leader peptidase (prepilin peptidase) / N-methyltransferase
MNAAAAAFALAPALALGSFLNVVVARVPARRSILRPPSSCGSCETEILRRDNVPLLSYLLLRGRCRHCEAPISSVYPLVEAATATLIVACVAVFGPTPKAALAAGFFGALVALSVIHAQHRVVPNRIVVPVIAVALAVHTAIDPTLAWMAWPLVAAGTLLLVVPRGPEIGDVKRALLLGAVLGASVTVAFTLGLFAAFVPAAILVWTFGAASARKIGLLSNRASRQAASSRSSGDS